jgi:hypothetical protein
LGSTAIPSRISLRAAARSAWLSLLVRMRFDEPADETARPGWSEAHPAQTLQV